VRVNADGTNFTALSSTISLGPNEEATGALLVTTTSAPVPANTDGVAMVRTSLTRWDAYLNAVLVMSQEQKHHTPPPPKSSSSYDMSWAAVKAVETLLYNWRMVPGHTNMGVLPSYTGYVLD
jgi:hypothetical protein